MVFGRNNTLKGRGQPDPEDVRDRWLDAALEIEHQQEELANQARDKQKRSIKEKEERGSKRRLEGQEDKSGIKAGGWVLIEEEGKIKTGQRKRDGPYHVLAVDGSIVTLESPKFPGRERKVHISRCTIYHARPNENPHEEALKGDPRYHVVKRVLGHRCAGRRPTLNNTEMQIQWAIDGSETWEPLKGVTIRRLAAVQEYVAQHPELEHLRI